VSASVAPRDAIRKSPGRGMGCGSARPGTGPTQVLIAVGEREGVEAPAAPMSRPSGASPDSAGLGAWPAAAARLSWRPCLPPPCPPPPCLTAALPAAAWAARSRRRAVRAAGGWAGATGARDRLRRVSGWRDKILVSLEQDVGNRMLGKQDVGGQAGRPWEAMATAQRSRPTFRPSRPA
jgi:hypothetical protein